jgi:hypothetical protein
LLTLAHLPLVFLYGPLLYLYLYQGGATMGHARGTIEYGQDRLCRRRRGLPLQALIVAGVRFHPH